MKGTRSSWWILAALTLGCVVLGVLQFRWTAELSEAESARLRFDLGNRLDLFAAAINQEATRQERELLPAPEELADAGWKRAHTERFRRWQDAVETPLFSRVMVARPEKDRLALYDVKEDGIEPVPSWPPEWSTFRATAERRLAGEGRPPSIDPQLWRLVEIPLFGPEGEEIEWLLLEVDADTVVNQWLPALAAGHLKLIEYRYEVQDRAGKLVAGEKLAKYDGNVLAFPVRFAGGVRRGRGGGGRDRQEMRWTIRAAHQQGSLDAVVQSSRIRNLSIAGALIGMIAAAGFALLRFTRQTREAAEVERRFFATVSHELRTPLTAIKSASQSLLDGTVKEERQQKQYAGIIARQAEQLTDLVEQVLYYAAAAARSPRSKAAVNTAAVLRSAIEGIAHDARAAGCQIEAEIPEVLPEILGDAASLRRLFQNLLHNAVRHGSEGKVIHVRAQTAGRELEVQVADRGKGLEDGEVNRIFEPFFRGERARSQQTRGAGIGLSVVRDIAQSHGGSVTAEKRKDGVNGALFTVRLPLMENTQ